MPSLLRIPDDVDVPLLGCIAFGVLDRGTNLLQVRPTTLCPLSCVFCSVDAGPLTRHRQAEFMVRADYLLEELRKVAALKGGGLEAHVDTVGDPLTHPEIVDIVQGMADIPEVEVISIQTHGALLTEHLAEELAEAGLSRINLSIDALNPELARRLAGTPNYDVEKVLKVAEYITRSTTIDLLISPVWVPGVNDGELAKIVREALRIGAGKRWPPLGIQKMEVHKYGRRPKGVKPMSWYNFYRALRMMEEELGVKLILRPEDFDIHKRARIPLPFRRFERVKVDVVSAGWLKGEVIGVAKGRAVTLVGCSINYVGRRVRAIVISTKDGVVIARSLD
ncbi:MAG: radical SAM protein [Candidatus Nezhaarchaeota archaeon]|nr:radical SAM protein [Candidatus Nezhaarchaeota archaeon]